MATELVIKSWCDPCLDAGEHNPGETLTISAGAVPAFDIELCPMHAKPLAEAVAELAPFGRGVGKGVPKVPTADKPRGDTGGATADYRHAAPGPCPECGHASPTLGSLRVHLRTRHEKSLADVGLAAANFTCPECGGKFPAQQGLAAHMRITHPGVGWTKKTA